MRLDCSEGSVVEFSGGSITDAVVLRENVLSAGRCDDDATILKDALAAFSLEIPACTNRISSAAWG